MNTLPEMLPFLMPVLGMLIGFVVIGGIFVVHPIVRALTRLGDAYLSSRSTTDDAAVHQLERRMARLEDALQRVLEHQAFDRELRSGATHQDPVTTPDP